MRLSLPVFDHDALLFWIVIHALHEAVLQLRGQPGLGQVRDAEVTMTAAGDGSDVVASS